MPRGEGLERPPLATESRLERADLKIKTRTKVIAALAFAAFMIVAGWALWAFLSPKEAYEATTSQPTKKFEMAISAAASGAALKSCS